MRPETRGAKKGGTSPEVPHLSHSRISRYLHCPEQYRLYYVKGLRPRVPAASLVFGQVVHKALAGFFRHKIDPVGAFNETWAQLKTVDLDYGERDSWEKCAETGVSLLKKFLAEEAGRLSEVEAIEEGFSLTVTSLGVPFVGVVDLVARLDGTRTVIDFKTAAKDYDEHTVILSDQLTAYQLAEPEAEQVALCVFVKGKTPRIEWYRATRKPQDLLEYLTKVALIGNAITAGHFYKRPGWWCGGCDYLPVCLGDVERARALIQVGP